MSFVNDYPALALYIDGRWLAVGSASTQPVVKESGYGSESEPEGLAAYFDTKLTSFGSTEGLSRNP